MTFLRQLFKGNEVPELIQALTYEGKSGGRLSGDVVWGGDTWSKRRDAAARLGSLGDQSAVGPLRAGLDVAVQKMNAILSTLAPAEVACLLRWRLTVLPESHTKLEYESLSKSTGTAMTIFRMGELEWAWATAIIHAEALAKLGEKTAPQQLVSELQKRQGTQWKEAESIFSQSGLL